MRITKLAQSTIVVTLPNGKSLLIDPGKYNIEPNRFTNDSFPLADVVIITHKHADHFDIDLVKAMILRGQPRILTNEEIKPILDGFGIQSEVLRSGDSIEAAGFSMLAIPTDHVVRNEAIVNFGLVISAAGKSIYHASDTRYIDPTTLPPETRTNCLLVPISNRGVVMGIDDALVFSSELHPDIVIPIHYDSPKDKDRVDPQEFATKGTDLGLNVHVMNFGDELEI